MTRDQVDDQPLLDLQRLPMLSPDRTRAEHVRARCHAAFARRQWQRERATRRTEFARRVLEPALVGGLCAIYISAVIVDVFRVLARW